MDRMQSNFCIHIIKLRPLIGVRIWSLLNILTMNGQNLIYDVIVKCHFFYKFAA